MTKAALKPMVAYEITNKVSGKRYIGITRFSSALRWQQHVAAANRGAGPSVALCNAIRLYGRDAFNIRDIACARDHQSLLDLEIALIAQENTQVPFGYNRTIGGGGIVGLPRSPEHNERIAESVKAVWASRTPEQRAAIGKKGGAKLVGRKLTDEHKGKVGAFFAGRPLTDDHKAKISANHLADPLMRLRRKGAVFTPEHKAAISVGKLAEWKRRKASQVNVQYEGVE